MGTKLILKCSCGIVQGVAKDVSPSCGNHVVCMCVDCQSYAHLLNHADTILDVHGGTEIFQLTPAQLTITEGWSQLRCVRLSPKGLLRWYAGCCNTPIANTLNSASVPFAGVVHSFIFDKNKRALGPILARVNGSFSEEKPPPEGYVRYPIAIIIRSLRIFLLARLKGLHKPSPFFDSETGQPVIKPTILSLLERERLRSVVIRAQEKSQEDLNS